MRIRDILSARSGSVEGSLMEIWQPDGGQAHRDSIVRNIEDEYRLPELACAVSPDELRKFPAAARLALPMVTIYRGVPHEAAAEIRPGDWVALDKRYASQHGGTNGKVISARVPADHVAWAGTDQNEFYYVPR